MLIFEISLPLDFINPPLFNRAPFSKQIIRKDPKVVNDDVVWLIPLVLPKYPIANETMRSHSTPKAVLSVCCLKPYKTTVMILMNELGDSFRHFAYQKQAQFYNGYL